MKTITGYFFKGLLVTLPVLVLFYVVNTLRVFAVGVVPGLSFWQAVLAAVLFFIVIGALAGGPVLKGLNALVKLLLRPLPPLYQAYAAFEGLGKSFSGDQSAFSRPVWVLGGNDARQLGFLTAESADMLELPDHAAVFIPGPFSVSGDLIFVKKDRLVPIKNRKEAVLPFLFSAGVAHGKKQREQQEEGTVK